MHYINTVCTLLVSKSHTYMHYMYFPLNYDHFEMQTSFRMNRNLISGHKSKDKQNSTNRASFIIVWFVINIGKSCLTNVKFVLINLLFSFENKERIASYSCNDTFEAFCWSFDRFQTTFLGGILLNSHLLNHQ